MTADAPTTIAEVIERAREANTEFSSAISAFCEDELTQPNLIGDWSVRDVIAHVGGDELWMAGQLEALRFEMLPTAESCYGGLDSPVSDGVDLASQDGRNAWQRERLRHLSLDDVRSMAREAHARLLSVISSFEDAQLPEPLTIAELKTVGWIRRPKDGEQAWPLWQWISGVTDHHFLEHAAAIRAAGANAVRTS